MYNMANYKKILMAVDLSDDSDKVAERALAIARNNEAELHVIHVIEPLVFAALGPAEGIRGSTAA